MQKKFPKILLLLALILSVNLTLSSCSLFKKDKSSDNLSEEAIDIIQQEDAADAQKNEKGLSRREEDFLRFGEERLANLIKQFNAFGEGTASYQEDAINKGISVERNKKFIESRDQLLEACSKIEIIPLSTVPENLKNFYEQNFRLANHCRQMIYQIERQNATNLPGVYNDVLTELNAYAVQARDFIAKVQEAGVNAAFALIPPVDWAAEASKERVLNATFDVGELGISFGATRAEVMGVEGLIPNYDKLEKLEYNTKVYLYEGVRKYFFNEFDQLYKVTYVFRPNNANPYNDLVAIWNPFCHSLQVPGYFDNNEYDMVQATGQNDQYYFDVDLPHLKARATATAGHPEIPIVIDIQAKLAGEAENGQDKDQE